MCVFFSKEHPLVFFIPQLQLSVFVNWDLCLKYQFPSFECLLSFLDIHNITSISVYTDSILSAHRALDPSMHLGQSVLLAVCKGLSDWLSGNLDHKVYFVAIPSKKKWPFHTIVHNVVTKFPYIAYGNRPMHVTLDCVHKDEVKRSLDEWCQLFSKPSYQGHNFLTLNKIDRNVMETPMYFNGGPWLGIATNSRTSQSPTHSWRTTQTLCKLRGGSVVEYVDPGKKVCGPGVDPTWTPPWVHPFMCAFL